MDFLNSPPLRDWDVFMWQSLGILNVFNTLILKKKKVWKTKSFFKNLEYRFVVESTRIESVTFPCKTAISEANVKANRMGSTKWTYHKECSFTSNCFTFFENFISVEEPITNSWFEVPTTQMFIFILFVSAGVSFEGAFSLLVSLKPILVLPLEAISIQICHILWE